MSADMPTRRRHALAMGLPFYLTGKPCNRGHVAVRRANNGYCTECQKTAEYLAEARVQANAWREANLERARAADRARSSAPQRLAFQKRVYEADKAKRMKQVAEWRKANPEAYRAQTQRRRAAETKANGSHTKDDIIRIFNAQGKKCAVCRVCISTKYQVDHIQPLSRGGSNDARNLQLLCGPCNGSKGPKDPIVWAQSKGLLL